MKNRFAFLLLLSFVACFYGCAGAVPSAEFRKPIADIHRLCRDDEATVNLVPADGVTMPVFNGQRLSNRLVEAINEMKAKSPCKTADKRSFVLKSKITRYDEGNAFARSMLAGLGQIHLDGDFALILMPAENEPVAEFTLGKAFAWGGAYGGSKNMQDIEPAFAQGVAAAIVLQAP